MLVELNLERNVSPCSLDFTQLKHIDGNLRYAVYSILSFSVPNDLNIIFKYCFLKKIYCGKLATSTEISHQSQ